MDAKGLAVATAGAGIDIAVVKLVVAGGNVVAEEHELSEAAIASDESSGAEGGGRDGPEATDVGEAAAEKGRAHKGEHPISRRSPGGFD